MSQDAKEFPTQEDQGVGRSNFDQRETDIKEHIEAFKVTLKAIDDIFSNDPEKTAEGLTTLADLVERDAAQGEEHLTQDQRWGWMARAANIVAYAKGGEEVTTETSTVSQPKWTKGKTEKFFEVLTQKGRLPPTTPDIKPPPKI